MSRGATTRLNVFVSPDTALHPLHGGTSLSGVCVDRLHYLLFRRDDNPVLASLAIINDVASRLSAVGAILSEPRMCP